MNVYEVITNAILSKLDQGVIPWRRPWYAPAARNWKSGKLYNGINSLLLQGGEYVTYRQALEAGGQVKRGEHGTPVVYFNWTVKENEETGKEERKAFLKYYTVFEVSQCEGLEPKTPEFKPLDFDPIEAAENIVAGYKDRPEIRHGVPRAFYNLTLDYVNMPERESFVSEEEYYSTLFHELTHSTAHETRLNRKDCKCAKFGSKPYSREELIAEIGAAMLCGVAHIEHATLDNSAAYIDSWRYALAKDSRLIVIAAQQAQKAADYIQGVSSDD